MSDVKTQEVQVLVAFTMFANADKSKADLLKTVDRTHFVAKSLNGNELKGDYKVLEVKEEREIYNTEPKVNKEGEELIKKMEYLFSKFNYHTSHLDAEAIQTLNTWKFKLR